MGPRLLCPDPCHAPTAGTLKLSVDRNLCLCTGLAPEVLELDEYGALVVLDGHPGPEAAEDVRDAVRTCPVRALILAESEPGHPGLTASSHPPQAHPPTPGTCTHDTRNAGSEEDS